MTDRHSPARRTLPEHFRHKDPAADTAGTPWSGRDYAPSPFPGDDGSVPPALASVLTEQPLRPVALARALRGCRVLVPIMATATEAGTTAHGLTGDNGADMAMVSITAPDGARTLPIFSSVQALARWRRDARPVPVVAEQAAQAAVQEGCTSLVLDPGSPHGLTLQRSILWALAQGRDWVPAHEDPELAHALAEIAAVVPGVLELQARPDERREVDLRVRLVPGLTAPEVQEVTGALGQALSRSLIVAERVTSLKLTLEG